MMDDIDDDVLSFFTNDIESDGGMDSADELIDMLNTNDSKQHCEDKTQRKETSHDKDEDVDNADKSDEDIDEDTQAKIAALQAQIALLKSSKKSPPAVCEKQPKNERKLEVNKKRHADKVWVYCQCKHGAPITNCFFCSKAPKDEPRDKLQKDVVLKSDEILSECKHGKSFSQCFFCSRSDVPDEEKPYKQKTAAKTVACEPPITKTSEQISKPKTDISESKSTKSIFDVLPTIEGKSTSEFSKKRRVAYDSNESEDSINVKKVKVTEKKGKEHLNLKKKEKVIEEKSKERIATTSEINSMIKGNAHLFAGIEISNPVMSSAIFDEKTKGRALIKISKIETKVKGQDVDGDWVTVGVVAKKVTQKQSSAGKNFCVWHLSDLCVGTENHVVALFLFGDSYKQHWKIQTGRVIALLNANVMKKDDKYSNQSLAITIDNPKKLMELGDSKYLGGCKGSRKSDGKPCTMYINKKYGDFCEYHVQAAFKKAKSGRMDLQSGGRAPRGKGKMLNSLKKDISEGVFYYGGKTVTLQDETKKMKGNAAVKDALKGKNDCSGLKSLMGIQVRIQAAKELNDLKLKREQEAKLQKDSTATSFLKKNRNELLNLTKKGSGSVKGSGDNVNKTEKVLCTTNLQSGAKQTGKEMTVTNCGGKAKGEKRKMKGEKADL